MQLSHRCGSERSCAVSVAMSAQSSTSVPLSSASLSFFHTHGRISSGMPWYTASRSNSPRAKPPFRYPNSSGRFHASEAGGGKDGWKPLSVKKSTWYSARHCSWPCSVLPVLKTNALSPSFSSICDLALSAAAEPAAPLSSCTESVLSAGVRRITTESSLGETWRRRQLVVLEEDKVAGGEDRDEVLHPLELVLLPRHLHRGDHCASPSACNSTRAGTESPLQDITQRRRLRGRAANLYDIRAGDQHEEVVRVPRLEHGRRSNATTS